MTLTQRLTRAGLVFVLLGTVAALLPTSGTANAETVTCTGDSHTYTLVQSSTDAFTAYTLGSTLTLNTYVGDIQTTATITASDSTNFTNAISANSITITPATTTPATTTPATNTVLAVFGNGGPTLSVTVAK